MEDEDQDQEPASRPPLLDSDPIANLLTTYSELNSTHIEELTEEPTALQFMRYVARNRPFVVRGGAADWEATKNWDVEMLRSLLDGQSVNVAVTPHGNADSPTRTEDGELLFVKPWEEQQTFASFVAYVAGQENSVEQEGEVRYAQTQNDNLRNEYSALFSHVAKDIPWARIALQQRPEAINFWLGNSRTVTALHKDNYENVYVQIIGKKHFVLLPPLAYPCVDERQLKPSHYERLGDALTIVEENGENVPFATWDPDAAEDGQDGIDANYSILGQQSAVRVTLEPGDMLYLPGLWYHKVSQTCSDEGICCAVNYWHDMEFGGSFYPLCSFVKEVALAGKGS